LSLALTEKVRPYRGRLALGALLLVLTQAGEKAVPWLGGHAVDALTEGDSARATQVAVGIVLVAAFAWVVRTLSRIQVFNVGRDVEFDLRNDLLARLHALGPAYVQKLSTGEIMSRATNDLGQVRLLVGFGALNVVNSILAFFWSIALMLNVSPTLTLWSLIPYPLIALSAMGFSGALFRRSVASQGTIGALAERVQESIAGARLIRSLGLEQREKERFEVVNRAAVEATMGLVLLRAAMWPVLMGLSTLGTLIVIWQGGSMVLRGELTPGQFASFSGYLAQLIWPTLAFGYLVAIVQRGRASYGRVREILEAAPVIDEPKDAVRVPASSALEVKHLSHSIAGRPVLSDVSFSVPEDGFLAIVGTTGSGKSVLAGLLARLLPTPAGSIFLGGIDVTTIQLGPLRRAIAYAPQEPFLFSTTVESNLRLAAGADAPRPSLEGALREAAVDADVKAMPEGIETVVGERGVQLSGGQKQRIALARALLQGPRILILDDPMSAVDARTEADILGALDRARHGRTLLLVTHRIAAAARADRIVVLDAGQVVASGTHAELLADEGGLYAKLARRQAIESQLQALSEHDGGPLASSKSPAEAHP
jgi:ATP-binding cassette subfamily B protein